MWCYYDSMRCRWALSSPISQAQKGMTLNYSSMTSWV